MSYITKCAGCKKELRLNKDQTEGMAVWCPKCWNKRIGGKS